VDGTLVVELGDSNDVEDSTFAIEIDVLPARIEEGMSALGMVLVATLILAFAGGVGFFVYSRTGADKGGLIKTETLSKIADSLGLAEGERVEGSGVPCWICSQDIVLGGAWACSECGARYHKGGQIEGCDIVSMGHCMHCDADVDGLVEA